MQSRSQRLAPCSATHTGVKCKRPLLGITPPLESFFWQEFCSSVKILSCGPSDLGPLCKVGLGTVNPADGYAPLSHGHLLLSLSCYNQCVLILEWSQIPKRMSERSARACLHLSGLAFMSLFTHHSFAHLDTLQLEVLTYDRWMTEWAYSKHRIQWVLTHVHTCIATTTIKGENLPMAPGLLPAPLLQVILHLHIPFCWFYTFFPMASSFNYWNISSCVLSS